MLNPPKQNKTNLITEKMKIKDLSHNKKITNNKKRNKDENTQEKSKQRAGWAGKLAI